MSSPEKRKKEHQSSDYMSPLKRMRLLSISEYRHKDDVASTSKHLEELKISKKSDKASSTKKIGKENFSNKSEKSKMAPFIETQTKPQETGPSTSSRRKKSKPVKKSSTMEPFFPELKKELQKEIFRTSAFPEPKMKERKTIEQSEHQKKWTKRAEKPEMKVKPQETGSSMSFHTNQKKNTKSAGKSDEMGAFPVESKTKPQSEILTMPVSPKQKMKKRKTNEKSGETKVFPFFEVKAEPPKRDSSMSVYSNQKKKTKSVEKSAQMEATRSVESQAEPQKKINTMLTSLGEEMEKKETNGKSQKTKPNPYIKIKKEPEVKDSFMQVSTNQHKKTKSVEKSDKMRAFTPIESKIKPQIEIFPIPGPSKQKMKKRKTNGESGETKVFSSIEVKTEPMETDSSVSVCINQKEKTKPQKKVITMLASLREEMKKKETDGESKKIKPNPYVKIKKEPEETDSSMSDRTNKKKKATSVEKSGKMKAVVPFEIKTEPQNEMSAKSALPEQKMKPKKSKSIEMADKMKTKIIKKPLEPQMFPPAKFKIKKEKIPMSGSIEEKKEKLKVGRPPKPKSEIQLPTPSTSKEDDKGKRRIPLITLSKPEKNGKEAFEPIQIISKSSTPSSSIPSGSSTNLSTGSSAGPAEKPPEARKTIRLTLNLPQPNNETYAEFNYRDLVKAEDSGSSKTSLTGSADSKVSLNRLPRQFSYLGHGYDTTDPFIDDSLACDEEVIDERGFFLNEGRLDNPLEEKTFKKLFGKKRKRESTKKSIKKKFFKH